MKFLLAKLVAQVEAGEPVGVFGRGRREREGLRGGIGRGDGPTAGLEIGLLGAQSGQKLRVKVPPEGGYGPRAPDAVHAFPRDAFPEGMQVEAGMSLQAEGEDGQSLPVWVLSVEAERVMVDFNHPLAGQTLDFEVTVAGLRDATSA